MNQKKILKQPKYGLKLALLIKAQAAKKLLFIILKGSKNKLINEWS